MNMTPLGFHNGGGRSPSSSNLSPLAPPFTLVKSYHKQQNSNSNPPVDYTAPAYGHGFDHSSPAWTPSMSSSFGPDFAEKSSKDWNFALMDVHTSSSTSSIPLNSAATDGFPYGKYPHSVPTSLVESEPFYPPHVADDRSLLAHLDPGYDVVFNRSGKLNGSSQAENARNGSGVEYTPQWNGLWSGLNDVEQGNWLDLGGSFGSKEYKPSDASTGQKYMKKGPDMGGDHYGYHAGTLPVGSKGPYAETSIRSQNCFEGFGGEKNFGSLSVGDGKPLKQPNSGATTAGISRVSTVGSTSAFYENFNLQDPFLQASPPKLFGVYEHPVDSIFRQANHTGSYGFDSPSTTKSSNSNMTKVNFGGIPPPQDALPSTSANEVVDKLEKSFDFLPYHPFSLNCQNNGYTGLPDGFFARSSSVQTEDNLSKKAGNDSCLDQLLKLKSVSPNPHSTAADRLKMNSYVEKSSDGPEIQNPGEDSPCWKGSPAANFSPFGGSKMVIPDVVFEKVESRANLKNEEHKSNPIRLNTADIMHGPGELDDNNSAKRSFDTNYLSKECDDSHLTKRRSPSVKPNDEEVSQALNKNHGTGNDFSLFNYSSVTPSSRTFQCLQVNSEGHGAVPEEKPESVVESTVAQVKTSCADVSSSCGVSPSENEATSKDSQVIGKDSNSVIHASVLINAMKNLSEILMCHCSDNHARPAELDHASLKQIISNLSSCLVKEADQATPTEKVCDSQQADTAKQATNAHKDRPVTDTLDDMKCEILCNRKESNLDSYVVEDGAETDADADTIQAIKRALDVNFPSEEMKPETLMYKNLWLEAEAALCATTVRSRVHRTKMEIEKRKYCQTEDDESIPISMASGDTKVPEPPNAPNTSQTSSKCTPAMESSIIARFCTLKSVVEDLKSTIPQEPRKEGQNKPPHDTKDSHPPLTSQTHPDTSESSVMDRFQILKSRADNAEDTKSPAMEKLASPSPDRSIKDSYFSSRDDGPEAAVIARLHILQSRAEQSGGPNLSEAEKVRDCLGVSSNPGNTQWEHVIKAGDEFFEGWYDDCSEPGWEHVVKEGWPMHQ